MGPERTLGEALTDRLMAGPETQKALGARLGVSQAQISKWKTGSALPSGTYDLGLARFLGIEIDEYDRLIGGTRRKKAPPTE